MRDLGDDRSIPLSRNSAVGEGPRFVVDQEEIITGKVDVIEPEIHHREPRQALVGGTSRNTRNGLPKGTSADFRVRSALGGVRRSGVKVVGALIASPSAREWSGVHGR